MAQVKRKLSTILAADCVGFSSHMEKNVKKYMQDVKMRKFPSAKNIYR